MAIAEVEPGFPDLREPGGGNDINDVIAYASRYLLDGEPPFPVGDSPLSAHELAMHYPARYDYLGRILEQVNAGEFDETAQTQAIQWFGMLNNVADYVDRAKTDPHTRVLYEKQVPVMEDLHRFLEREGHESPKGYVSLPMATGKTVIFTQFAQATGARTLVVAPSREIVDQTEETFNEFSGDEELDIGRVYTDEKRFDGHITITTYKSLLDRTDETADRASGINPKDYGLVILDEAHHAQGEKTRKVLRKFDGIPIVGFTGSEDYSAKRRLETVLPTQIHKSEIAEVVESGLIAPYINIVMKCHADMSGVEITTTGQYEQASLQRAVNTPERNSALAEVYERVFRGHKAIGSCAGVNHAIDLAAAFRARGINAQVIHGGMTKRQRKAVVDGLKKPIDEGGIEIVFNDKVLTEGVNFPGVSLCLNAAPTLSFVREKQRGGRALRLNKDDPQKVAIVWDTVDDNYRKPPVLFADSEVSGAAMAFPSWIDIEEHGYRVPSFDGLDTSDAYEIVFDPESVAGLAAEFAAGRTKSRQRAPEGWYSEDSLFGSFNVPKAVARRALAELREIDPEFVAEETARYAYEHPNKVGLASGMHYSELIREALAEFIDEPSVAPILSRTAEHVVAMYDGLLPMSPSIAGQCLGGCVKKVGVDVVECVPFRGESKKRLYYTARTIAAFAEYYGLPDYSAAPPPRWEAEEDTKARLGKDVYTAVMERVYERDSRLVFSDIISYEHEGKDQGMRYFSPHMQDVVKEEATPPSNYLDTEDIADALEISAEEVESIIQELRENKRLNKRNTFLGVRNNIAGTFFRDDMPEYIRTYFRHKEAKTTDDLRRQEALGQMIGELTVPQFIPPQQSEVKDESPSSSQRRQSANAARASEPSRTSTAPDDDRVISRAKTRTPLSKPETTVSKDEQDRAIVATLSPTLQALYEERRKAQEASQNQGTHKSSSDNSHGTHNGTAQRTNGSTRKPRVASNGNSGGETRKRNNSERSATQPTQGASTSSSGTERRNPVKISAIERSRMRQQALAKFSRT